ncbi:hypothetical protein AVEN_77452-1 [Araneus ventricosus]|uniref:Uncharacterized protein n=1 Tax=Araneus ventricosus TaxID=182803 RepID=A0A4Y2W1K4_ARAVE|nr:hypothetical protein AVEN_77452-1 [Araneus ventricosus]
MRSRKQTEWQQLLMESSLAYPRGKESKSTNSKREKTERDKTLGYLGVVKPVTPGEGTWCGGPPLCKNRGRGNRVNLSFNDSHLTPLLGTTRGDLGPSAERGWRGTRWSLSEWHSVAGTCCAPLLVEGETNSSAGFVQVVPSRNPPGGCPSRAIFARSGRHPGSCGVGMLGLLCRAKGSVSFLRRLQGPSLEERSGFWLHLPQKEEQPPRHILTMATIKEVYDMATESDNTVVDSSDESNNCMMVSDDNKLALVPNDSFNPFLLAPTTSMFGGKSSYTKEKEGHEPETKKSRRKRKGETGGTNKEKRDKREGKHNAATRESPKKDSSGIKIFSDFWASTPDHPKIAAITNSNTGKTPDLNLYDAISEILAKYKIEGNPATEIKDLVQVAVGQICALRSSVHNMEDRMNKMEERLNAHNPAPTFATIARAFATSSETNTTKIVNASNKPVKPKIS